MTKAQSKKKAPAKKGGRPSAYKPEYAEQVVNYCLLGATNEELATIFGVSKQTINAWMHKYPEFLDALKAGRQIADAKVATALYNQAVGGNTTAQIFWLKNRRAKEWREKQEIDLSSPDGTMSPTTDAAREAARKSIIKEFG